MDTLRVTGYHRTQSKVYKVYVHTDLYVYRVHHGLIKTIRAGGHESWSLHSERDHQSLDHHGIYLAVLEDVNLTLIVDKLRFY